MSRARSSSLGMKMRWNSLVEAADASKKEDSSPPPPTPHDANDSFVDGIVREGLIPRQRPPCINPPLEHNTALLPRYSVAAYRSVGGLSRCDGSAGKHEKSTLLRCRDCLEPHSVIELMPDDGLFSPGISHRHL